MQDNGNNHLALKLIHQRLLQLIDKPNLAFSFLREDGAFVVPLKHVPGLYKERFGIALSPKEFGYLSVCELVQVGLSSYDVVVMDLPSLRRSGSTKQYMGRRNTQPAIKKEAATIQQKAAKKKKKVRFADEIDDKKDHDSFCVKARDTQKTPMNQQSPMSLSLKENQNPSISNKKTIAMVPPKKPAMKPLLPSSVSPKADLCGNRCKQPPIVSNEISNSTPTRAIKPDTLRDTSDIALAEYFTANSPVYSVLERRTLAFGGPVLARNCRLTKINKSGLRLGRKVPQKPQLTHDIATSFLPTLSEGEDDSDGRIKLLGSSNSTLCDLPATHNDFAALLALLPTGFAAQISNPEIQNQLSEIILDYGRKAMAWVNGHRVFLGGKDRLVSRDDIKTIASKLSITNDNSRAYLDGQLHRITPAQNAKGEIIGFSMRIGRHTAGCADIIDDLLHGTSAKSVLLLGGPVSGKTTMLRDIARSIASKSSVIVIDSTNDIGGDGDTPHASIGLARRVMIPSLKEQSKIALKCLRSTSSIVIDKCFRHSSDLEVAKSCAEQGIQLVTSATCANLRSAIECRKLRQVFGVTGFNGPLYMTADSTGGSTVDPICVQRVSTPLFDCVLEATGNFNEWRLVSDTASAIDQILNGKDYVTQIRTRNPEIGSIL